MNSAIDKILNCILILEENVFWWVIDHHMNQHNTPIKQRTTKNQIIDNEETWRNA